MEKSKSNQELNKETLTTQNNSEEYGRFGYIQGKEGNGIGKYMDIVG